MLGDLKLLSIASALARHSAQRHQVVSENIANADTPGFKAKDLEPFADAFTRATSQIRAENGGASNNFNSTVWRSLDVSSPGLTSPNGNTVSLEDQMVRSVQAQGDHDAAVTIYKKTIDILRLSLGRNV